jgi:hypothetical protein
MRQAGRQPSWPDLPADQGWDPAWRFSPPDLRLGRLLRLPAAARASVLARAMPGRCCRIWRADRDTVGDQQDSRRPRQGRTPAAAADRARSSAPHRVARDRSPVLASGELADRSPGAHPIEVLRGPSRHAVRSRQAEPAAEARNPQPGRTVSAAGTQRADRTLPADHSRSRRQHRGRDRNHRASHTWLPGQVRSRPPVRSGPRCRIRAWQSARIHRADRTRRTGHSHPASHSHQAVDHTCPADHTYPDRNRRAGHAPAADRRNRRRVHLHRAGRSHCRAPAPDAWRDHRDNRDRLARSRLGSDSPQTAETRPPPHGLRNLRARRNLAALRNRRAARNLRAARNHRAAHVPLAVQTGDEPGSRRP